MQPVLSYIHDSKVLGIIIAKQYLIIITHCIYAWTLILQIPQASTCFNIFKLSDYSCEQELRNKTLIAIRYGCEGFAFS